MLKFLTCPVWIAVLMLTACAGANDAGHPNSHPSPVESIDAAAQSYVAFVHTYWIAYKTAEGDIPTFIRVCWGQLTPSPATPHDLQTVDPAACQRVADAILPPHESFLSALDTTPPPAKFARDDGIFRTQLPKAISDLKAMASAAAAGDRAAVIEFMTMYYNAMVPEVTGALDDVDPAVVHT